MKQDMSDTFRITFRAVVVAVMTLLTGSTVTAQVTVNGNVYGGGNLADVKTDTRVNMSAGTVKGNVFGGGKGKADNFKCDKAMVGEEKTENADANPGSNDNKDKGTIVTISNGTVGTLEGEEGSQTLKEGTGNVYGGGEIGRVEWNTQVRIGVGTGEGTFAPVIYGSVFGAGKGLETHGYSALVRGNSTVTVQGGAKVGYNVYGGGEKSTVGRYWVKGIVEDPDDKAPEDLPDEMPYKERNGGNCRVTIRGNAEIGYNGAADDKGHVFGAGKGVGQESIATYTYVEDNYSTMPKRMIDDPGEGNDDHGNPKRPAKWEPFEDDPSYIWEYYSSPKDYYVFLQTLSLVTNSYVTIYETAKVKGSVYGGSESGFVQTNTNVTIQGDGCEIGETNTYGDVFGGGKGLETFAEAGEVKGTTTVIISGGTMYGSVYGGGELGEVGTINKANIRSYIWEENTGKCDVTIDGATAVIKGSVFGAGRGKPDSFWCEKAMVYETNVIMSGGTVEGNVYGGGEKGRVENNTEVTIGDGTKTPVVKGSVFGAGMGLETHGYSALVRNNATVNIHDNATIGKSVYGGGQIASVGRYGLDAKGMPSILLDGGVCTVTVTGAAKIGTIGGGDVFGAGKGVDYNYIPNGANRSKRMMTYNTTYKDADKGTTWDYSDDTEEYVWEYFTTPAQYSTYLETLALATHPIVTIGGGAEVNGSVYGGGEKGITKGAVEVNINGGTIMKDVYGGGALADTNTGNWSPNKYYVEATGLTEGETYFIIEDVYTEITDEHEKAGEGITYYNKIENSDDYVEVTGLAVGESLVKGYYTKSEAYTAVSYDEAIAESRTYYETKGDWTDEAKKTALHKTTVNLLGGLIKGDAYGGGLGDLAAIGFEHSDVAAMVYGDVSVTLGDAEATNATAFNISYANTDEVIDAEHGQYVQVVNSGRVFGCNNLNGSPMGSVLVTVNKTKKGNIERTHEDPNNTGRPPMGDNADPNRKYELAAVYGGGNLSDYVPYSEEGETEKRMPKVRLNTCDISVEEVYGGGNAAKVPATDVLILGAYEIENVFGGGNGADKYTLNGTTWITNPGADVGSEAKPGDATTLMKGGYIHSAYGGSNSKGDVFGTVYIDKTTGGCDGCPVQVDKMVAAGNNADFNRDVKVVVGCQGSDKTPMRFFGADNANVNGNVEVTITSGNFGQVFAGNNIGGAIRGHIIMNIEETSDCEPIRIDELYLGGNEAAYSRFGYYIKTTTSEGENAEGKGDVTEVADLEDGRLVFMPRKSKDDPHLPVNTYNREENTWTVITNPDDYPLYDQPVLNIISCTRIGEVFGGGFGKNAIMYADPTVNINMIKGSHYSSIDATDENPNQLGEIGDVFGGGNAADIIGNTTVNIGMATTVTLTSVDDDTDTTNDEKHPSVLGAYITGNVFGGGNLAEVSGNTNVNICGTQNPVLDSQNNPVLDSQNKPTYTDTSVSHSGTFAVSIGNSVYGGGNAADVLGNTFVTMADGYVFNGIFGGGLAGSVGTFTRETNVTDWGHDPDDSNHKGTCIGKPKTCTAGGTCYVVVSGGQIGPVEVATEGMNRKTNGHGDPVPQGWVWGAGCGLVENPSDDPDTHFKTYVNETDVTIKGNAFILESIIGGGEFGRVLGNTLVKIEGGQIGVGEMSVTGSGTSAAPYVAVPYTPEQWAAAETAVRSGNASEINAAAALMPACSHFPYGRNTGTEQNPHWVYDTYDPFADEYNTEKHTDLYPGGSTDNASDGKTWIGCVFAGGSGYMPYKAKDATTDKITDYDWVSSAGWVEGNAEVRISGGHILTNVYGGNEYTDVKGKCMVTMTGGTIGVPRTLDQIKENPMIGNIFGAGRGDPRVHFNKTTNVEDVEIEISGGTIFGSVFGGGEDGHVLRDVAITIENTTVTVPASGEGQSPTTTTIIPHIGTWGTSYVDGNVFGGGRGFTGEAYTAGNVAGSVKLEIKGGNILGSVYGGGRMGSVGYGLFDEGVTGYGEMRLDTDTEEGFNTSFTKGRGHTDIIISGGTIGNNYEYIIPNSTNMPDGLSVDNIGSWTPANWTAWKNHNNIPKTEFDTSTGQLMHTKGGNVFAGGMGNLYEQDGTTYINKVDWWRLGCVKSTKLTITGGTIKSNVYGGGELGQVVGYHTIKNSQNQDVNLGTEITIQGSSTIIGTGVKDASNNTQYTFGSVFGGGYGSLLDKITVNNGTSDVTSYPKYIAGLIKEDTKIDMQGGAVKASIYGGGEMASVGESTTSGETTTTTGNTYVAVSGGTVGIEPITVSGTMRYFGGAKMGNVYGGGSGHNNTVRSGRILKNTNVTISGGTIYHNVYGGGAYGTVGDFTYSERDETVTVNGVETTVKKVSGISGLATSGTGVATVTITGGTIGYDGKENGMVFGSSRGDINMPGKRDDYTAWVYDTHVTIGTTGLQTGPQINGTVYGSGENGHTFNDTSVEIHSGTIGIEEGLPITSDGVSYSGAAYPYRGNVYGGGCGTDTYTLDDDKDGNPDDKNNDGHAEEYYNPEAGIVRGNATVTMDGGHVVRAVYGGGAMGSVGTFTTAGETYLESHSEVPLGKPISCIDGSVEGQNETGLCTVTISGGKIGPKRQVMPNNYGNVFGAGRGEAKDTLEFPNLNISAYFNKTVVTISETALVRGSVYGGSESGHVLGDTWVKIQGGQIGCGKDSEGEPYNSWDVTSLLPCASWDYEEDGYAYDMYADADDYDSKGGMRVATDGHTFYGNVFGGGSGYTPYAPGKWIRSAGRVEGNTQVDITGGHILTNVYGGNECTDVWGNCIVNMSDGTVGVPRTKGEILSNPALGHLFGAGKGDKRVLFNTWTNVASTEVNITGGKVYGSVYGGGEDGHVLGDAETTINKESGEGKIAPVIGCDGTSGYDGNVFGGGQGSTSALTAGVVGGNIELNILDGQMSGSVYGGGRLAAVGTYFENPTIIEDEEEKPNPQYGELWTTNTEDHGNIAVSLTGGTIAQNVFGGGMGTTDDTYNTANKLGISRNVTVELNKDVPDTDVKGCVVGGSIFGCNNLNTSPRGTVTVYIYKTQNAEKDNILTKYEKGTNHYDLLAVYGGGNMAAYEPTDLTNGTTRVIIDGCDRTSIRQVYGGGNAASTPATDVEVKGTYEIFELFGGGNGADRLPDGSPNPGANVGYKDYHEVENDSRFATKEARVDGDAFAEYRYGTGVATVNVKGGTIHRVFGGSNTKGNVRKTALTLLEESTDCPFCVDEAYGGGKSAPMDAEAQLHMACIPGLKEAYGGAEAADIQGDVTLTITNGTFNRVFGGNNISGTIRGSITVNVEETGCKPIIIGELYGGGNQAGYSVRGYKKVTEGTSEVWKPRMPEDDLEADMNGNTFHDPQVNIKSFTSIGEVYGGGYGEGAVMVGSPKVSVNEAIGTPGTYPTTGDDFDETGFKGKTFTFDEGMATEHTVTCPSHVKGKMGAINNVFGGGNAAKVVGDTYVNIGTLDKVIFETPAEASQEARTKTVMGADIRGNVYGGGNKAEVTGKTNVVVGKRKE